MSLCTGFAGNGVDDQTLDGGLLEHRTVKAVVLYESMTGNTRRAAELIGGALASAGDEVAVHAITDFNFHELAVADVVFVGTWVDGLVLFGQRPGRAGRLRKLPVLDRKPVAVFCTYAINAGNALDKTAAILEAKGALIPGRRQFRRDRLEQGVVEFVDEVRAKVTLWQLAVSSPE
ncbi:MAG: flavodoxin [Acidimicrobiaceae bacterium]